MFLVALGLALIAVADAATCGPPTSDGNIPTDAPRRLFYTTDGGSTAGFGIHMLTGENPYPGKLMYAGGAVNKPVRTSQYNKRRVAQKNDHSP